jgi:hypothetical protein
MMLINKGGALGMKDDYYREEVAVEQFNHSPLPFCASRDDIAPLFRADAFINDEIQAVDLKDFRGSWMILFFYSSDFTFV